MLNTETREVSNIEYSIETELPIMYSVPGNTAGEKLLAQVKAIPHVTDAALHETKHDGQLFVDLAITIEAFAVDTFDWEELESIFDLDTLARGVDFGVGANDLLAALGYPQDDK